MAFVRRPGDVEVTRLVVYGRNWMDLTQAFIDLSVYESVLAPAVVAELRVRDDKDLASILPLVGEERVEVEFAAPGGPPASYLFHVDTMVEGRDSMSQRDRFFTLRCVSVEFVDNAATWVQKSYNAELSSVVRDLLTNHLGSTKPLYVEKTRGVQKIIVQNERPFHAIDRIRRRSVSIDHRSSAYLFYETQAGYAFCTVEELCERGREVIGDRFFTYDPLAGADLRNRDYRNAIAVRVPRRFAATERIRRGMTGTVVQHLDLRTLGFTSNSVHVDPRTFALPGASQSGPSTPEFLDAYSRVAGRQTRLTTDGTMPPTFHPEVAADRNALSAMMAENSIRLHVFGDSALKAGDVVEFNAPTIQDVSGQRPPDRLLSGNYLVTRLRHIIRNGPASPQYTCALECVKGGYEETP